jgi:hypothetical protein
MVVNTKALFYLKLVHTAVFFYMCVCLGYLLYAGVARAFGWLVVVAIASILGEGLALLLNRGRCPLTTLAEKSGALRGSVTDLFLPAFIARNTFRFSTGLFVGEIVLLAVRYFGRV